MGEPVSESPGENRSRCSEGDLFTLLWRIGAREQNRVMPNLEADRLAKEVTDLWAAFQEALSSEKRKYPIRRFRAFWSAAKRYAELTNSDSLLHKSVATAVNGLVDFISAECKRVPGDVLRDAERLGACRG
jgi:hypothetical protein